MEMFSDCSGPCHFCAISYYSLCLAGHGDDEFISLSLKGLKEVYKNKGIRKEIIYKYVKRTVKASRTGKSEGNSDFPTNL